MSLWQQKDLLQSNTCKLLDTSHNRLHTNLIDRNWDRHRGNRWQHTAYCRHLTAEARLSNLQLAPHMMVACASPSPWVRYCQYRQFWSETIDHCVVVYNQRNLITNDSVYTMERSKDTCSGSTGSPSVLRLMYNTGGQKWKCRTQNETKLITQVGVATAAVWTAAIDYSLHESISR